MRKARFYTLWLRREALCRVTWTWKDSCFPLRAVDSLYLTPWLYKGPFPKKSGLSFVSSWAQITALSGGDFRLPPSKKKYCVWHILTISSKEHAKKPWVQRNL